MNIRFRRLNKIIARRSRTRLERQEYHLENLRYQLDDIPETFPTTETPYTREPFIYEPYPNIYDVPPIDDPDLNTNRQVKFGTITEFPIDNKPFTHPSGSKFPPSAYADWNRHAPILLDFLNFIDPETCGLRKGELITEYWKAHTSAPPVEAIIQERLTARAQFGGPSLEPVRPTHEDEEDTCTTAASTTHDYPTDEEDEPSTTSSDDKSTPSKRQRHIDSYTPGPCVPCTISTAFPGHTLDTAIFGTTLLTHLDTSGRQFSILPNKDYHFNDVTISLDDSRTGLRILAICPEVVDVSEVPDTVDTSTIVPATVPKKEETPTGDSTTENRKRPFFETKAAHTHNTRPNLRPAPTDDSSVSTLPTRYQDPDYSPSDTDEDTSDSDSDNESRTTPNAISTANALIDLSLEEVIDLTQPDTEYGQDSEAGDIIVYNVASSTEFI
jgi:hypothetical protein